MAVVASWFDELVQCDNREDPMKTKARKRGKLAIGIVGLGGIGNRHAQCYVANKHTKVVAVCDIIKERADKAAAAYDAPAFYSVKEMLASGVKLDACSMATAGKENEAGRV